MNDFANREGNPKIICFDLDLMKIIEVLYIIVLVLSIVGLVQKIRRSDIEKKR